MCRQRHGPPCHLARTNNRSINALCEIVATLAEKSPTKLPVLLLQTYSSRNQEKCTVYLRLPVKKEKTGARCVFNGRATQSLWLLRWGALPRTTGALLSS